MLTSLPLPYHNKRSPAHSGDELPFLGDELQNRGACGASAPTQGGSPPKASPARGGGCAARRRRRGALPVCGKNILQGPAGPCPAPVGDDARIVPETLRWRKGPAAGEIARPTKPPRAGSNAQTPAIRQARRRADARIGPYAEGRHPQGVRRAAVPGLAARMPCIVGRAFTPAGGLRQTGRVLARQGAAPLSRLTPTAPLTGEPFGWKPFTKPPLQGEVDAPQGADGGVHCRFAAKISCKARQDLALPP